MPARRAEVRYASGQAHSGVRFLDTRGQAYIGVALCQRCQTKRRFADLTRDGNIKGFMVCLPELSPGCWDQYDPMRLPAPPPDDLRLPFVRPDNELVVPAADEAQLPLEPPSQDR